VKGRVERRELEMASQLIDSFTGKFDPSKYKDTYRDSLKAVIAAKRKGREVHLAAEAKADESPPDLMEALRQSVAEKSGRRRSGRPSRGTGRPRNRGQADEELAAKTKGELLKLAQRADLPGRSQMDKKELVKALRSV
jgi:DNA end-binding protein Ku